MVGKLIGLVHDRTEEEKYLRVVESCFSPGATLWVEHVTLYPITVRAAKRARMKVRSLDSMFTRKLLSVSMKHPLLEQYVDFDLRERSWVPKVKQTSKCDVIVMHPEHARHIAALAKIPKRNIRFIQQPIPHFFRQRMIHPPAPATIRAIREYLKLVRRQHPRETSSRHMAYNEMPRTLKGLRLRLREWRKGGLRH